MSKENIADSKIFNVEAFVRPSRIQQILSALLKIGIRGVTVSDVLQYVGQRGSTERHSGSDFFKDNFVPKVMMEFLVSKDQMKSVINIIIDRARTGEIGDEKIYVAPVSDVRTGERGEKAEKMTGDMLSSS